MWDYIAGFGAWEFHPGPTLKKYHPGASDIALGELLRSAWLELAVNGSITTAGWERAGVNVSSSPIVLVSANASAPTPGWDASACTLLAKNGFGQPYWWVN